MKEVRFFYVPNAANESELPADEAMHALRVLRLQSGDEMMLMDGVGNFYKAEVSLACTKRCVYTLTDTLPQQPAWRGHLHLALAPTKMMERVEWCVEKATEIGVDELSFVDCKFSERHVLKVPRIDKIVVAAMKQSRKAWLPVVNEMESFAAFVEKPRKGHKYIAHCYDEIPRKDFFDEINSTPASGDDDVTIMIGPEGDFSVDEVRAAVKAGFVSVSLGRSRLRTETAGIAAAMMMQIARRLEE